jgi:acyl-CoA synthetase (AMP-forming)/AMP-acid ligase II
MLKRYADLVAEGARRTPDKTAVAGDGRRVTFAQLDDRIGRLGAAFRTRGLEPGDRVSVLAANELEYVELQAACLRSGFTLVPLNWRLAIPELEYILRDCAPRLLIAGRAEGARAARLAESVGIDETFGLGETDRLDPYDELLESGQSDPEADPLGLDLLTTILYTSGTTGRPKGAMIDRAGMTARVFVNAIELEARSGDVFVEALPMFHISAFLAYAHLFRGGTVVQLPTFSPAECLALLQHERATSTVLVPTMIKLLLEDPAIEQFDPSALRLIIYGGASIDPQLLRRALAVFRCGFHQQYGMTETGAQTILRPEDHDPDDERKLASGGLEAVGFEVRIHDPGDRPVSPGEIGEICCRGPAVMCGYWGLPDESAETLRGGWMHTGDLGFRDERGYLHVADRRNDMIISGGENVYPREVEAVLAQHPAVRDVAVIGLPDETWGQIVTAVVVGGEFSEEEMRAYLQERVAGYKVPRRWIRMDDLPRNVTGKVLKGELRAQLGSRSD